MAPATHTTEAPRDTVGVLYLGYHGPLVMTQKNLDMTGLPPAANSWGATNPVPISLG
jgi:hypothetical protein